MNILTAHDQEWEKELSPYNQYEEERTLNLESVFEEFRAYHASSKANQNLMKNHEIHFGTSYSIENFQGRPELQPYYQNEVERGSNLDKLLMQFMETTKSTQQALQSVEIQVGELAEAVTQFMSRQEKSFVEVEANVSSIGACRPRIFFINGFLCFLEEEWQRNGEGRERGDATSRRR